ncbi:hypothetical protein RhiJN_25109 [Ceratobasidium sp. AG-Ba]|nr:hypothetical protein RhiJN_25109 [Ceratobasidium sp. AG-Ba]
MATPNASLLIAHLRQALQELPADLPLGSHRQYPFAPFSYDQNRLESTEDLAGTVSCVFKQAFGWRADSPLVLKARGTQIEATANVLEEYITKCPENSAILVKWAEDLLKAARVALGDQAALENMLNDGKPPVKRAKRTHTNKREVNGVQQTILSFKGSESSQPSKNKESLKRKAPEEEANTPSDQGESDGEDVENVEPKTWVCRGKRYPLIDSKETEHDVGRPALAFLKKASLKCQTKGYPGKERTRYRCISNDCARSWASRAVDRISKHTVKCRYVSDDLRRLAELEMVQKAPSVLAAEAESALDDTTKPKKPAPGQHCDSAKLSGQPTLRKLVGEAGRKQSSARLDVKHTYLFCQAGIPLHIADLACWKDAWNEVAPYYKTPTCSKLADALIPREASHLREEKMKLLSKETGGMTLSFDGGSTTHQSFTSISVITANRRTFLLEMPDGSGESHTGEFYKLLIETWILRLGIAKVVAIVSDNASNARNGRSLLQEAYPTIQNLPDACHKLNSLIGDICGLEEIKKIVVYARKIISHFHHSLQATALLESALLTLEINSRLRTIGNTRFANVLWAIEALIECLPGLRKIVTSGQVKIKDCDRILRGDSTGTVRFELELKQVAAVLAPIARAIVCLESPFANPADVYMHWLALAAWLQRIFKDDTIDLTPKTVEGIVLYYNHRFQEVIDDAPSDIYFTALCLDPRWRHSKVLGKSNHLAARVVLSGQKIAGNLSNEPQLQPKAYKRLGEFLYSMIGAQRGFDKKHGLKTYLTEHKTSHLKRQFDLELDLFSFGRYPFVYQDKSESPHDWWRRLACDPASLIPAFAVRIYDICPNSMVDERVMSNVTWLNSPLRNRQRIELTSSIIEVRQWANFSEKKHQLSHARKPALSFKDMERTSGHRPDPPLREGQPPLLDGAMLDLLDSTVNGLQDLYGKNQALGLHVDPDISVADLDELTELLEVSGGDGSQKGTENRKDVQVVEVSDDEDGEWGEWRP